MYVDMGMQTWTCSPGINVATHKSQSCCLSWCSCFAGHGSKSTLMSGVPGRGLRPGSCTLPLAVHMSLHCLWQSKFNLACLLQNSKGVPAPSETFLWLALRRGPIFGAVGLHVFCLHCVPCMYVYNIHMYIYVYIYIYIIHIYIYVYIYTHEGRWDSWCVCVCLKMWDPHQIAISWDDYKPVNLRAHYFQTNPQLEKWQPCFVLPKIAEIICL